MSQTLPVIDIADLDRAPTRRAIHDACRDWGFFQITSHGIGQDLISSLQATAKVFFAQPRAEKRRVERTAANPWGYYDREFTQRTRDWKEIYDIGPADGDSIAPQWPAALPAFRPAVEAFYAATNALALRIVRVISANLGMPERFLDPFFRPIHTSFLRLNRYPTCAEPARPGGLSPGTGHLGVNHHTDAGAVTLLLQDDVPGLEVYHDGVWVEVEPRRGAIVVNIGDIVQVWSNDRYRAALHRAVVNTHKDRYSAPFFFNPSYSAEYSPLPSTTDAAHPPRYRPIRWGEFRALRTAGDYADHGEYVHIGHYRR